MASRLPDRRVMCRVRPSASAPVLSIHLRPVTLILQPISNLYQPHVVKHLLLSPHVTDAIVVVSYGFDNEWPARQFVGPTPVLLKH